MKWPNYFIVGAPKCGTTSLATWLSDHPDIFMPRVKEPNYYNQDLGNQHTSSREAYAALFEDATDDHLAVGEASVWYLYSREAVPRLLDDRPEAKIIVILRNPMEMAHSLHDQMVTASYEHITDFRRAWDAQKRRSRGADISWFCPDPKLLLYGRVCRLGQQLQRLYRHCSRDQVLPIVLDDVKADPGEVYRKVLAFLGVPDDGRRSFPVMNVAKERRSMLLYKMMKSLSKVYNKVPILRDMRGRFGVIRRFNRWNSANRERMPMSGAMRQKLRDYFYEDVSTLSALLERDLSGWLSDSRDTSADGR